jgi:tetratricopeptide (TPR) repeat protein
MGSRLDGEANRHLHFSLHRGAYSEEGLPPTVPMPELITLEMGEPGGFSSRPSWSTRCSRKGQPWAGSLYASENDARAALYAQRARASSHELVDAAKKLRQSLERRTQLWHFSTQVPRTTSAAARRFLAPILAEEERDPVTHYGWAVEVEMTEGRWQAALRHLERARELNTEPQLFEPWIEAWIDNQEGAIALRRRQPDLARKHFDRAARLLRRPEVARFAANEWARSERGD